MHVRIGDAYRLALCSACNSRHGTACCQLVPSSLEDLQLCTPLAKQKHVAQRGTTLSKDTAVLPIAVLPIAILPIAVLPIAVLPIAVPPIVSKSNVTHCRVTWCSSATLAENAQTD